MPFKMLFNTIIHRLKLDFYAEINSKDMLFNTILGFDVFIVK